jgi:toxin CcdB
MARFDVYENTGASAKSTPFLLEVQSNLLDGLDSTVVVPLRRASGLRGVKVPARLMPAVKISGRNYLLETPKLAAVPRRILKTPVASLAGEQESVMNALDFLFQGY